MSKFLTDAFCFADVEARQLLHERHTAQPSRVAHKDRVRVQVLPGDRESRALPSDDGAQRAGDHNAGVGHRHLLVPAPLLSGDAHGRRHRNAREECQKVRRHTH